MTTTNANLYVDRGIDFVTTLELFDADEDVFNVSNYSFECAASKLYSTEVYFSANVNIIQGGVTNDLELFIPSQETVDAEPGKYVYDVVMTDPSGSRQKILEGIIFLLPTITKNNG